MRVFSALVTVSCLLTLLFATKAESATLTWDCTRIPNICSNDCYAIQCLGKPSTLHRDSADATAHRAETTCKSPNRCSGGSSDFNSCDEYPYASSQEGGAQSVTRCVSSTENSRQGGTLSSFYSANNLKDGDAYNLAFTNTNGLEYCSASCTNSGNELLPRRSFASIAAAVGIQHRSRKFTTSSGHEITMFEPVSTPGHFDSLIGTQTWLAYEERFVTIISAIV